VSRIAPLLYYVLVVPVALVVRRVRDPLGTRSGAESSWVEVDQAPPSLARACRMR
jgi:hypothetical protein